MFNNTDDIFQLKLYNKFAQIGADSPHLKKNKADGIVMSVGLCHQEGDSVRSQT